MSTFEATGDMDADIENLKVADLPVSWSIRLRARFWRVMMAIGMFIGRLAPPIPLKPTFYRTIPTTISPNSGNVKIHFYVPRDYSKQKFLHSKKRYPCIVNFHGGGFTIGSATDDCRWASCVVAELEAIVASVEYRLAPEHPFPTAIEDGVDALMYISKHAEDLMVDTDRIAVSGFSSGGNMAFTVPLRLQEELEPSFDVGKAKDMPVTSSPLKSDPDASVVPHIETKPIEGPEGISSAGPSTTLNRMAGHIKLVAIVSWYPSTDYTQTREQRRATNLRKDMELSATFTQLFDTSYLQPPSMNKSNPYLSPGVAPQHVLSNLPNDIIMYICEYDMLAAEGRRMRDRLQELEKSVVYTEVKGVPHGWDKSPNPLKEAPGMREHYKHACRELRRVFKEAKREARKSMDARKSVDAGRKISMDFGRLSVSIPRMSLGGLGRRDNNA